MGSGPTVSVLIPTFQHAKYLRDAIDSALAGGSGVEVIVADGGSSDETVPLLVSYGDRVKWLSEPDSGQSEALNRAIALATGDIVGWLNADEYYLPGWLSRVTTQFANCPELSVLCGDVILVDRRRGHLRRYAAHSLSRPALKMYDCYVLSSSVFYRRTELNGFAWDESLRMTMDWDLFLHLDSRGARFDFTPHALSAFRVLPEQASQRLRSVRRDEVLLLTQRYGIRTGGLWPIAGRLHRTVLKVRDGAYLREAGFALLRRGIIAGDGQAEDDLECLE